MRTGRVIAASLLLLSGWAGSALSQAHWGYAGEAAPENWAKLDPRFVMCGIGKNQSPIDLAHFVKADLKPLTFAYVAGATEILNNGHTVQVGYAPGSSLAVDGRTFRLQQFHFHSPSEHTIEGRRFPLEAHLVHGDDGGNLAVVSVMFQEGAPSALLEELWDKMPGKAGDRNALPAGLNVSQMLPGERHYYRFSGSLTTPPCSEGVTWLVLKKASSVSRAQIGLFSRAIGQPNNRPVQPVNARSVLQ